MFSSLPPEILSTVYSICSPTPPLPPSRQFVPHFRQSLFNSLDITSFDQLSRLSEIFDSDAGRGLGEYVKRVEVGFQETSEELLSNFERNPTIWIDLLVKFDGLRELKCRDWMSTSLGILSTSAAHEGRGSVLAKLEKASISVLLTQLNQEDFVLHRLSVLAQYGSLNALEVVVQPFDPSSTTTNAFELFPSVSPQLDGFPPASVHQVRDLSLVGPLCDRRLQTVLALFDNVASLSFFDLFSSSQNLSPLLATLRSPHSLVKLKLSQLYSTSLPINLPPSPNLSFAPLTALSHLEINVPLPGLAASDLFLPSLSHLAFSTHSTPSFDLVHDLLVSKPPALSHLVLSHISGSVGPPLSRETYPLVVAWLSDVLAASAPAQGGATEPPPPSGPFPIPGWDLPEWPAEFDPNLAEVLFALAKDRGVSVEGSTLISAMLTAYVMDKALESWKDLVDGDDDGTDASREERDEMEAVFGDPRFWDALALRYRARLGLDVPVNRDDELGQRPGDGDEHRMGQFPVDLSTSAAERCN
ncbi:hypothetical protein JCM11491_005309 [Sporobolomyces phaffii]